VRGDKILIIICINVSSYIYISTMPFKSVSELIDWEISRQVKV